MKSYIYIDLERDVSSKLENIMMSLIQDVKQKLKKEHVMFILSSISYALKLAWIQQLWHQNVQNHMLKCCNISEELNEKSVVEKEKKREWKNKDHIWENNIIIVKYDESSETAKRINVKIDQVSYHYHCKNLKFNL